MRALLRVPTLLILVVFLVLLILWPSPQDNRSQRANSLSPDSTAHVLKLGYNMPSGSAMDLAAVRFAEQVEKLSAGRLKIELHPNQQLGNDHQMLEMARQGTIDLLLTPTAKLSSAIPEMQYPDLPFYFPAKADLYAMLDGEPGRRLLEKMRRIGLVGITFWGNGFKQFTANHSLLKPEDFSGYEFRIMKSRLLQDQFWLLDAESIPIDFHQVRAALRDGVVEGEENPLAAIFQMGIHEVQTDLTISDHGYLAYAFAVSEKSLARLPSDLQLLIVEQAREQTQWQRDEIDRQEADILSEIVAAGVNVHHLSEPQREQFRRRLRPLADRFEAIIGADLMALTDEYLLQRYPGSVDKILGVDVDLSGLSADIGLEIRRGVALALADQGDQLAMLTLDNLGQPSRAVANIERFGKDQRVIGLVGGTHSSTLSVQLPKLEQLQLPLITPFASESIFYRDPISPWLFSVASSNPELAEFIVAEATKQGVTQVAVVVDNNRWGQDLSNQIREVLNSAKLSLAGQILVNAGGEGLLPETVAALADKAEMVVLGLHTREGKLFLDTLAGSHPHVKLISVWDMPYDGRLAMQVVSKIWDPEKMERLLNDYQQRYGEAAKLPTVLAQSYDSAHMLAVAASTAQPPQERVEIRKMLENLPGWAGVMGYYTAPFTSTRHAALDRKDYRLLNKATQ